MSTATMEPNTQRTVTFPIFKWSELSEDRKEKALDNLREINTDYDWWNCDDFLVEKAKDIGIDISMKNISFDLDRGSFVCFDKMKIVDEEFFCKKAGVEHKESTDDQEYMIDSYTRGEFMHIESNGYNDDEHEKLETCLQDFLEECLTFLRNNYEYLISDEAIIETIETNDYDFYEDGSLV